MCEEALKIKPNINWILKWKNFLYKVDEKLSVFKKPPFERKIESPGVYFLTLSKTLKGPKKFVSESLEMYTF